MGLNWDSFKYRNYDYAIGRFFGIDPIAEEFYDISTYQFTHNNPVWKVELEGLEGVPFQILANADAAAHPNGVGAHVKGFTQGLFNSAKGLYNAVTNLGQTAKGVGNTALAGLAHATSTTPTGGRLNAMKMDNALGTNATGASEAIGSSISNGAKNLISGNGEQRGEVLGELTGAIFGAKGMNAAVKGVSNVFTKTATVGTEAAATETLAIGPLGMRELPSQNRFQVDGT